MEDNVFLARKHRPTTPSNATGSHKSEPGKGDVFELFTVKTTSTPERLSKSSEITFASTEEALVQASTPSKSSTKTYREKINERFKSVKEKVGRSAKRANVHKRDVERLVIDRLKKETGEVDTELEGRRHARRDRQEGFNFFSAEICEVSPGSKEELDNKSTENLVEHDAIFEYNPVLNFHKEIKDAELQYLYMPKSIPVPLESKIDGEPKYLEDEGLFVSRDPKFSIRTVNLLEQRLSKEGNKNWFNCEGKLNFIENPVLKTSFRMKEKSTCLRDFFEKSQIEITCNEVIVVTNNVLQLQISNIQFCHHPLFSKEHVFEQRLRKLVGEHQHNTEINTIGRLTQRLKCLRLILSKIRDDEDSFLEPEHQVVTYKRDAKKIQEMLLEESREERSRVKKIIETWKELKKVRTNNNYSSTRVRLLIVKEKRNYEEEKIDFEEAFEAFYEETVTDSPSGSEEDERFKLLEYFKSCMRPPGEPILHFALMDDNEISKEVDNSKELIRRQAVSSTAISLRILCNGLEVCKVKSSILQPNFACNFDETISIQSANFPKYISVEIVEYRKTIIRKSIGKVKIKLPHWNMSRNNKSDTLAYFENQEVVTYKHEGVGSGLDNLFDNSGPLMTSGFLTCCLYWDKPRNHLGDNPTSDSRDLLDSVVTKNGGIDLDRLSEWMDLSHPDPQDPKNRVLFEYSIDSTLTSKNNYFRLDPFLRDFRFCDPKTIDENIRLRVLQLRNSNEPEFEGMVVPNRTREITFQVLQEWKRRVDGQSDDFLEQEDEELDDEIDERRIRGWKYLKQIHIKIFQICKSTENHLSYEDVVDEKFLHYFERYITGLAQNFVNWFKVRPVTVPLPRLTEANRTTEDYYRDMHYQNKVVIKILSGLNIPQRNNGGVSSFIEITLNEEIRNTSKHEGQNPNWNEQFYFNLPSTHSDYLNPNSMSGILQLNLFDEIKERSFSKYGGGVARNYLGCVQIPLSSIVHDGIKGHFKVSVPDFLFGYNMKEQAQSPMNILKDTYLNLKVFVEPNIPMITPSIEELPCDELPYIKDHALDWNEKYNSNFPSRKFSVFALDVNSTSRCIIRYIKPLEPPQINAEAFDVTPEQCVRYVSLIPFTECNQFYQNIWLTVDQFLKISLGSVVDHAVAVTCYLLALKLDVWLVLGFGLPHGNSACVLIKEYDHNNMAVFSIFDVVRGEKIQLIDPYCPLQRISCIVNENNVWANIQKTDNFSLTRFDFNRRSDWWPLFNNKIVAPTNSAQVKTKYISTVDLSQIELILERKIRKKISKLRPLDVTTWNHQVSNAIKSLLSSFELSKMNKKNNSEVLIRVKEIIAEFNVKGFIINDAFINISTSLKKILDTGVHCEEDSDVQFASAVYLKSYPGQILTSWIFVASLLPKIED